MCKMKEEVKYRLTRCESGQCNIGGKIRHYVTLTFNGKEEDGYYDVIIPKVLLPFGSLTEAIVTEDNTGEMYLSIGNHFFPIEPVYDNEDHFHMVDFKGNDVKFKGERVVKVKTKDVPAKEMTMEEIEKALGYRIKIVKEK